MPHLDSSFPRRQFLKGAVGALGASALGLGPVAALAKMAPTKIVTLAYWDGTRFVLANRLASGDATLTSARLTLRGFNNDGGVIKAIDAYFVVPNGTKPAIHAPFSAWVSPPRGAPKVRFVQSVDPTLGILLKLQLSDATGSTASTTNLISGTAAGNKLKEGTYVLVSGAVDMNQFTLDLSNSSAPLSRRLGTGAVPQYIVIDVERA